MSDPDVSIDDIRTLGRGYWAFCDHQVVENSEEILFILRPVTWKRVFLKTFLFSLGYVAFVSFYWRETPGTPPYLQLALLGGGVCGWPVYVPLLRRWLVRTPMLRVNKREAVVELGAGQRCVPLQNVLAVCDVVAADSDGSPMHCELQLLIRDNDTSTFVLLAKSLGDSTRNYFTPIASELAQRMDVGHLSADLLKKTLSQD